MALAPCVGCGRHVEIEEGTCPFCGAVLVGLQAAPTTNRRLTRAAAFAFSASVAAAALVGCGGSTDGGTPLTEAGTDTGAGSETGTDTGSPGPMYGAAFIDGGSDSGAAKDSGVDAGQDSGVTPNDGGGMTLYGAPPYGLPPSDAGKG